MVSTLAAPSEAEDVDEWDIVTVRQVKEPLDGVHACDELAGVLFAANSAFIRLELVLVTLEQAFTAVGRLYLAWDLL